MRTRDWTDRGFVSSVSAVEKPVFGRVHVATTSREQLSLVPRGWRRRLFEAVSFPVVLTLILLTVLFALCRGGIADPDIWWHLHNAEYLVQHHSLPRADMYSFTVAGHPWINHEWVAELPYYLAWRTVGLAGINLMMFFVLALIFLGVLHLC